MARTSDDGKSRCARLVHGGSKAMLMAMLAVAGVVRMVGAATTWYVAPWGDDENDGLSWATAMKSPELVPAKMIAASAEAGAEYVSQHTLIISNGYYRLTKEIRLSDNDGTYKVGEIHIRSLTGNPEDVVLDGQGQCRGIQVYGGWSSSAEGLTVTNCVALNSSGAGIFLRSTGRVVDCIVRDCHITMDGGASSANGAGIAAFWSRIMGCTIENCSITNATGVAGKNAYGAGIFDYYGMVSNCVIRNCAIRMNAGDCFPVGAGIYVGCDDNTKYESSRPRMGVFDTVVSGCVIDMPHTGGGLGAGIYARSGLADGADGTKYQAYLEDCLVHDCTNHYGGAIYCYRNIDVLNVTSSNNYDACLSDTKNNNATGLHLGSRCNARNCLITCNIGNTGDTWQGGSPAIYMAGNSTLVDSAVVGNVGKTKIGIIFKDDDTSKFLVSNCVFRANRQTNAIHGGLFWISNISAESLVDFVDCYFTDNDTSVCTWGGWVWLVNSNAGRHWTVRFRNCLCTDNSFGKNAASVYAHTGARYDSNIELLFENCTIANNTIGESSWMIHGYEEGAWGHAAPSNIYVRSSIVVNNTGGYGQIYGRTYSTTTNVNYSIFGKQTTWEIDPRTEGNSFPDSSKPLFLDAANRDYRLAEHSQAINRAPVETWMGTGKRNGPQDLGSGYTIASSGKYGVTIQRNNASRRLSGASADAGCCEYYFIPGFQLNFR